MMKKFITSLILVYFLISWKEFGCDVSCPSNFNNAIPVISLDTVYYSDSGSCSIKVVDREARYETEDEADQFIRSLNLRPLSEDNLNNPNSLKWGFKKKKVVISEKKL